jgi:hypothetical protein
MTIFESMASFIFMVDMCFILYACCRCRDNESGKKGKNENRGDRIEHV